MGQLFCTLRSSSHNRSVRLRFTCMGRPLQNGQHTCQTVKLFLHQGWFLQLQGCLCLGALLKQTGSETDKTLTKACDLSNGATCVLLRAAVGISCKGWQSSWDVALLAANATPLSVFKRQAVPLCSRWCTQYTVHLERIFPRSYFSQQVDLILQYSDWQVLYLARVITV